MLNYTDDWYIEKYVLLDLYNSTDGKYWYDSWNYTLITDASYNHCNLVGIYCDGYNSTNSENNTNNQAFIVSINITSNDLTGIIPKSVCLLSLLKEISLSSNHLNGTIPDCIGNITLLSYLDLSNKSIYGSITQSICKIYKFII